MMCIIVIYFFVANPSIMIHSMERGMTEENPTMVLSLDSSHRIRNIQ